MRLFTPFDPWQSPICTCPLKLSLSPYTGCSHRCLYCYASSYIRNFGAARPKKDFIPILEKEIKKVPSNSFIAISNSSDPYQPLEKNLCLTRSGLEILKDFDLKIMIVTKSSLILRDLKILKKINNLVICITITTLNNELAKKLEAGASPPEERMQAIRQIAKLAPVILRLDPLIYPLTTEEIATIITRAKKAGIKQVITSTYKAKPDDFAKMRQCFPQYARFWTKLYSRQGQKYGQYIYLPTDLRKKLIEKVRYFCQQQGLDFSSCREGFPELNTKACDGSGFFTNSNIQLNFTNAR